MMLSRSIHVSILLLFTLLLSGYTPSPWDVERITQEFIADCHHYQIPVDLDMVRVVLANPPVHPGNGSLLNGHYGLSSWKRDVLGRFQERLVQLHSGTPYTIDTFKMLVYHELAHAAWGQPHTEEGIMRGHLLTQDEINAQGGMPKLIDKFFLEVRIHITTGSIKK